MIKNFKGAKYDEKGNPTNKAAELHQKFEGQKPEDVIDGLFENWKLDNPTSLNDNVVKRFKQIIYMFSNYTHSKYAINKGYNDDINLIAPYYFKLISNIRELDKEYWVFKDCRAKLCSSYFNFNCSGPIPPAINYWKEIYKQEKPFKKVDNKWYFVVWRGDKNNNWRGIKFQINPPTINPFVIDNDGDRNLQIADLLGDLVIVIGIKH